MPSGATAFTSLSDVSVTYSGNANKIISINSGATGLNAGYTVGTSANNLVQLTNAGKLPAVDGSLLTNLPFNSSTSPLTTDGDIYYRYSAQGDPYGSNTVFEITGNSLVLKHGVASIVSNAGIDNGGSYLSTQTSNLSYLDYGTDNSLSLDNTDFTIESLFTVASFQGSKLGIICGRKDPSTASNINTDYLLYYYGGTTLFFNFNNGSGTNVNNSWNFIPQTGTSYYVRIVYQKSTNTISCYINGNLASSPQGSTQTLGINGDGGAITPHTGAHFYAYGDGVDVVSSITNFQALRITKSIRALTNTYTFYSNESVDSRLPIGAEGTFIKSVDSSPTYAYIAANDIIGLNAPLAENTSRDLSNSDNQKVLVCTGSLTFNLPLSLPSGFSVIAKGNATFTGASNVTVNDLRDTSKSHPYSKIIQYGNNSYDIISYG